MRQKWASSFIVKRIERERKNGKKHKKGIEHGINYFIRPYSHHIDILFVQN